MIRVLIADHQPIVSYGIRMLFESSNDVKLINSVSTKKQLIDYLKKGSIDVVLLSLDFSDSKIKQFQSRLAKSRSEGSRKLKTGDFYSRCDNDDHHWRCQCQC